MSGTDNPGWSDSLTRALGEGFGLNAGTGREEREQRKHRALCNGYMCERAWCERGQQWRATQPGEKWRKIDGRAIDATTAVTEARPEAPETGSEEQTEKREPVQATPASPDPVQAGTGDGQDVEAFTPPVKRGGRPRKYGSDAERKRAHRARRRG